MICRDSALYWFPRIEAAGLPVPKTAFVPYDPIAILPAIEDARDCAEYDRLYAAVWTETKARLPVFLRTDITSAKHRGPVAYKVNAEGDLNKALWMTLEESELKTMFQSVKPTAIMAREFLNLKHTFTAFHGLPIARERRLFADGSNVWCDHPYWPPEAIEGHTEEPDWPIKLGDINGSTVSELQPLAIEAAKACGGDEWSVDFALDINGKWWLTDMATAANSYHWKECCRVHASSR